MKAVYLLPCSCGNKVRIDAGQAGAKVPCACGQQLTVPTFRALKELEQETPPAAVAAAAAQASGWSPVRGVMFSFGLLTSLVAAALISYHLFIYLQLQNVGEGYKQHHLEEQALDVDYLAPADALANFQDMAKKGLSVDGVPPWSQVSDTRDSSRRWLTAELVALTIGLVSLVASLIGVRPSRAK